MHSALLVQVQSEGSVWGKDHDALARLVGKVSLNIKAMGGAGVLGNSGDSGGPDPVVEVA